MALAILFVGIAPGAASATCLRWDVNGAWIFTQGNDTTTKIELQQAGDKIRGSGGYREYRDEGSPFMDWKGSIDGSINGNKMQLTVYWDQGSIGIYNAKINPDGSVEGGTYDKRNPNTYATWTGDRRATCTQQAPGVGTDGRPVKALGRIKLPAGAGQCPRWDLGAVRKLTQAGTRDFWVALRLSHTGSSLVGDAKYYPPLGPPETGRIDGTVSGNEVNFTATWSNSTTGVYSGSIDPAGRVTGYTHEKNNPGLNGDWSMVDRAVCDTNYHAERTGLQLGRAAPRDPSAPVRSICDSARAARARNSPTAPALEARCLAVGETTFVQISSLVDRNELDRLAAIGLAIARADYSVLNVRRANPDLQFRFGFDVASALFGDPALGGQGVAAVTTESQNIRASLDPASQPGFDESANFHFSRNYGP